VIIRTLSFRSPNSPVAMSPTPRGSLLLVESIELRWRKRAGIQRTTPRPSLLRPRDLRRVQHAELRRWHLDQHPARTRRRITPQVMVRTSPARWPVRGGTGAWRIAATLHVTTPEHAVNESTTQSTIAGQHRATVCRGRRSSWQEHLPGDHAAGPTNFVPRGRPAAPRHGDTAAIGHHCAELAEPRPRQR